MAALFLSDNFLNNSGADFSMALAPIPVSPVANTAWTVNPLAGVATFTEKYLTPGLVDTASTSSSQVTCYPRDTNGAGAQIFLGPSSNFVAQVGVRVDANDNVTHGVGDAFFINYFFVYFMRAAGVLNVYHNIGGLLAPVPTPSGSDYCLRVIADNTRGKVDVWVANMSETLNPNASFTKVYSGALSFNYSQVIPTLFARNLDTRAGGSGFYSPQYSDGSYPFQAFWQTFDNGVISNPQFTFTPYANGWVGSARFDFSLSSNYSYTLPTALLDVRVAFEMLEISNVGNSQTIVVTINGRKTQIPAGAVVTLNLDEKQYPQFSLFSSGGACRVTAYAKTAVNYQTFR